MNVRHGLIFLFYRIYRLTGGVYPHFREAPIRSADRIMSMCCDNGLCESLLRCEFRFDAAATTYGQV